MVRRLKKGGSGVQPFMKKVDPICDGIEGGASACAIAKQENDSDIQTELIQNGGSSVVVPSFDGAQSSGGEAYTANGSSQQTNEALLTSEAQAKLDNVPQSEEPQIGGKRKYKKSHKHKKSRKHKKRMTKKNNKKRKTKNSKRF